MAQHYANEHAVARHRYLILVADAEQEAVLNWVPHKSKKKKPGNAPMRDYAAASSALRDVASSSSSLPPMPSPQPKTLAPTLPSESQATTSGAE